MNAQRRKTLAKAVALLEEAQSLIEEVQCEEQETFDNMGESLQQTERGQGIEQFASDLEDIANEIESQAMAVNDIIEA